MPSPIFFKSKRPAKVTGSRSHFCLIRPSLRFALESNLFFGIDLADKQLPHIIIYYIDKCVFMENRPLVNIRNYTRDSSNVFFISSLRRISRTSFLAFTLLFVQKCSCLYNKKEITRWLEAPPCKILYILVFHLKVFYPYCFWFFPTSFILSP